MNYKLNWSEAAKYGLILASVSVVINLVTNIFSDMPALLVTLLRLVKFCTSAYLVYYAMKRYNSQFEYVTYGQTFGFGMAVCALSAIVCTLFDLLTYTVFLPDALPAMLDQVFAQLDSMGMSEVMDYDTLLKAMPSYIVIADLFSCILIGLIISAIMASPAKKTDNNPFNNTQNTQE